MTILKIGMETGRGEQEARQVGLIGKTSSSTKSGSAPTLLDSAVKEEKSTSLTAIALKKQASCALSQLFYYYYCYTTATTTAC